MNRWRQRLAELHGDGAEQPAVRPRAVQNVQNVQNQPIAPAFEHFEHFEQPAEPGPPPPWAADHAVVAWKPERAATVQNDRLIPHEWAEGFARLDPDQSPADVPLRRWQHLVDDVGLFLDSPFCAVATALGWGPYDLFGCDRDRPFARIDQAGLLWLLNGDRLVILAEDAATVETRTGARHTIAASPTNRAACWHGSWRMSRDGGRMQREISNLRGRPAAMRDELVEAPRKSPRGWVRSRIHPVNAARDTTEES